LNIKAQILGCTAPLFDIQTNVFRSHNNHTEENSITADTDEIKGRSLLFPGIIILDIEMYFAKKQTITTCLDAEAVTMNFISGKNVEAIIEDLENKEFSKLKTHNIIYAPTLKATVVVPALEEIKFLSIIVSPTFYFRLINENWDVHEKFSSHILQKKPAILTPKYVPLSANMQWIIDEIKECDYQGPLKKMFLEAKIKELLVLQIESLQETLKEVPVHEKDYSKLLEAKRILDANFTNAPSIQELSRIISLNEFKLKKGFKACFQCTVKNYATKLRMEYAKKLFKNQTSNVSEVAYKCGYRDVSHFSAAFKSYYGFTPVSFRKMQMCITGLSFFPMETLDILPLMTLV
jgi:AraC-like DNA-binding protein